MLEGNGPTGRKLLKSGRNNWYKILFGILFASQKKVLILQIEQELFDRNTPYITEFATVANTEFATVAKSLPPSLKNARK